MAQLTGKTALITGAGDGIGRAIAKRYASEGANIVIAELNADTGANAAQTIASDYGAETLFVQTDVTQKAQLEAVVTAANERFGGIDILVNNAWGGGSYLRAENKTDVHMQHGLAMNLWAGFWAMKAVFPHMKKNSWGRIVNICSINGVDAYAGTLEYNVGKEALRTLTRSMAREWAPYQICANAICPAAATAPAAEFIAKSPDLKAAIENLTPMGRMGDPDTDIAGVALFLASDDARYLTGNTLFVDGGTHINGSSLSMELPD
jgi:NAD(P)-dependent dehydrogenase (short-subunit alcohol dehydrogenase family)